MKRRQNSTTTNRNEGGSELAPSGSATSSQPSLAHNEHSDASAPSSPTSHDAQRGWVNLPSMRELMIARASSSNGSRGLEYYHRKALRRALQGQLDRVNVLGDDVRYGHSGCVNALSWALDGELLISGGDDTTVRLWRLDRYDTSTSYPYKCDAVIHTGHTGNIFNAQLLPYSSKIATVAGDRQVRVFDVERAMSTTSRGREIDFGTNETLLYKLRCHKGRTKRIVTEESPDTFLSVAEDGAVRQHDLRMPHQCGRNGCPQPLVELPFDLSTLALSPLAPYHFVVAGESQYGYLFDRRQVGRTIQDEWGVPCNNEDYVTCLRRFGRKLRGDGEAVGSEQITGARMAQTNSYEVLLSYSGDAVYLYSTRDEPSEPSRPSSVLSANSKKRKKGLSSTSEQTPGSMDRLGGTGPVSGARPRSLEQGEDVPMTIEDTDESEGSASGEEGGDEEDSDSSTPVSEKEIDEKFKASIIMPRRRFSGHRNIDTIKDVNFVGPEDEFVVSGSDGGHFFLWDKESGKVHGIYEGDGSAVNVIECHPRLPLIACSGIDKTVKLFAPTQKKSKFSRMDQASELMKRNSILTRQSLRDHMMATGLFLRYRAAMRLAAEMEDSDDSPSGGCTFQ